MRSLDSEVLHTIAYWKLHETTVWFTSSRIRATSQFLPIEMLNPSHSYSIFDCCWTITTFEPMLSIFDLLCFIILVRRCQSRKQHHAANWRRKIQQCDLINANQCGYFFSSYNHTNSFFFFSFEPSVKLHKSPIDVMLSYFYINFKQRTRIWCFVIQWAWCINTFTRYHILRISGSKKSCKVKNEPFLLSLALSSSTIPTRMEFSLDPSNKYRCRKQAHVHYVIWIWKGQRRRGVGWNMNKKLQSHHIMWFTWFWLQNTIHWILVFCTFPTQFSSFFNGSTWIIYMNTQPTILHEWMAVFTQRNRNIQRRWWPWRYWWWCKRLSLQQR